MLFFEQSRHHITQTGFSSRMKTGIRDQEMNEISPHPVILAIESSAEMASAAVIGGDAAAVQHSHMARHGHAALITELARAALAEAGVAAGDLTHVAAGRGPGSFTGIRVALAAAKGFVIATGAAGIGVSCLAAMAHAASISGEDDGVDAAKGTILATADTRRGSFFAQLFDGAGLPMGDIAEIDPEAAGPCPAAWQGAVVIGAGAAQIAAAFPAAGLTPAADPAAIDATQVARLAVVRLAAGMDTDPLLPLYVAPAFLGPTTS
jgi:tRNA threonylcarbamoyladenosine biosynthesis protein TsaB